MTSQAEDISFYVDGLTYRGLVWGDPSDPLVFAIHGWLDNALSFVKLAPMLKGYRVLSIDLSGHGLSSHRSPDANYHIWDDIPQLLEVVEQLGLSRYTLLATAAELLWRALSQLLSRKNAPRWRCSTG